MLPSCSTLVRNNCLIHTNKYLYKDRRCLDNHSRDRSTKAKHYHLILYKDIKSTNIFKDFLSKVYLLKEICSMVINNSRFISRHMDQRAATFSAHRSRFKSCTVVTNNMYINNNNKSTHTTAMFKAAT